MTSSLPYCCLECCAKSEIQGSYNYTLGTGWILCAGTCGAAQALFLLNYTIKMNRFSPFPSKPLSRHLNVSLLNTPSSHLPPLLLFCLKFAIGSFWQWLWVFLSTMTVRLGPARTSVAQLCVPKVCKDLWLISWGHCTLKMTIIVDFSKCVCMCFPKDQSYFFWLEAVGVPSSL